MKKQNGIRRLMALETWFGLKQPRELLRRTAVLIAIGLANAACSPTEKAEISTETKFSQAEMKAPASPRVTEKKKVRKGGGRYQVGEPYQVKGKWYKPEDDPDYVAVGLASWYGPNFHGRLTANGEVYNQYALSAAHPTLPLPSYARVTNLDNGRSVIVRVNDRGPFAHDRIIDLSARAADVLNYQKKGVASVKVEYVGKARMDGRDDRFLMASYRAPIGEGILPGATQPGTMLALAAPTPLDAIESAIEDSVLMAGIPVPSPRPGLMAGGLPFNVAIPVEYQVASLEPMRFVSESRSTDKRFAEAFEVLERRPDGGAELDSIVADQASRQVILVAGTYDDRLQAEAARQLVATTGLASIRPSETLEDKYELRLMVGGDVASAAILALRAHGFDPISTTRQAIAH
jgi:peptidoglycan lytic transglycosylase